MIKSIYQHKFLNQNVLVRVDFNVPIDKDGKITDDKRIEAALSTIDKIIDDGGIPILVSHLGRPKGERKPEFSMEPVANHLRDKFGYKVIFASDCIGEAAKKAVDSADHGDVVILENLRYYKQEEKNDADFAKQLASLADVYVNDAFGAAHRAHASTEAAAKLFEDRFAGKLMLDELDYLGKAVDNPNRPFLAAIGGAKISGKIDVIRNLFSKCDSIIIGGGMMFTFYKAMGYEIGNSILEEDKISLAKELIDEAKKQNINMLLPVDVIIVDKFDNDAQTQVVKADSIPAGWIGMDIGPESQKMFADEILIARTVVWNGPMGVFEMDNFAKGTLSIAEALAETTSKGAITIVGGGDSASAIKKMKYERKVSHVSTGGGASLEYLEGKVLPGVVALDM